MKDMELRAKLEALAAQGEAAFASIGEHALANMPTLRDRFAMAALTGFIAGDHPDSPWPDPQTVAKRAYAVADAMLAEREGKS